MADRCSQAELFRENIGLTTYSSLSPADDVLTLSFSKPDDNSFYATPAGLTRYTYDYNFPPRVIRSGFARLVTDVQVGTFGQVEPFYLP
jgi:hypothetical protein